MCKPHKYPLTSIAIIALSCVVYFFIYGIKTLIPTNIYWLYSGPDDLAQHYLGWVGFRNSGWFFPFGLTDSMAYPLRTSIVFTDSIPLFAIVFKILSPLLPNQFQYFGIYGLLTFSLNGYISSKILKRYFSNNIQVILGSMFFIFSMHVVHRMYYHTALASHWLILLALYALITYQERMQYPPGDLILWSGIGVLCASIHPYFVVFDGIILCFFCIACLKKGKMIHIFSCLFSYILSVMAILFFLGAFSTETDFSAGGLGVYGLNLNGFVNSMGKSLFLDPFPHTPGQTYEGFAYLGLGILVLLTLLFIRMFFPLQFTPHFSKLKICLAGLLIISYFFALSPSISFGETIIYEYKLPTIIASIVSTVRVTSRGAWICIYLFYILALHGVTRCFHSSRVQNTILILALSLQLLDASPYILSVKEEFSQKSSLASCYVISERHQFLTSIFQSEDISHLVIVPSCSAQTLYSFVIPALENEITLNRFYFARSLENEIVTQLDGSLSVFQDNTAYIIKNDELIQLFNLHKNLNSFYHIPETEYTLALPRGGTEYLNNIVEVSWDYHFNFNENQYLKNGYDENGIRTINSSGYSHGPLIILPSGKYKIVIEGDWNGNLEYKCYSVQKYAEFRPENIQEERQFISFTFDVQEIIPDFQIQIINNSDSPIHISNITISPVE